MISAAISKEREKKHAYARAGRSIESEDRPSPSPSKTTGHWCIVCGPCCGLSPPLLPATEIRRAESPPTCEVLRDGALFDVALPPTAEAWDAPGEATPAVEPSPTSSSPSPSSSSSMQRPATASAASRPCTPAL